MRGRWLGCAVSGNFLTPPISQEEMEKRREEEELVDKVFGFLPLPEAE
jgi:hypothetical protein